MTTTRTENIKSKTTNRDYEFIISAETAIQVDQYRRTLISGEEKPGKYFAEKLKGRDLTRMSNHEFLDLLIQTKKPAINAESEIKYDGSDWNQNEVRLLSNACCAVSVDIYDNGVWKNSEADVKKGIPKQTIKNHNEAFQGNLLFVPGVLLQHTSNTLPPDNADLLDKTTRALNVDKYEQLNEQRILAMLFHANEVAKAKGTKAFITIPGLGCGNFAGTLNDRIDGPKREMREHFKNALIKILEKHGDKLKNIQGIYYDPKETKLSDTGAIIQDEDRKINGIDFLVRPGNRHPDKPQLCRPEEYGTQYRNCEFFSVVAWDPVSFPGNEANKGERWTDDGVKAMATNAIAKILGISGNFYNNLTHTFLPQGMTSWLPIINKNKITMKAGTVIVVNENGERETLQNFKTPGMQIENIRRMAVKLEYYAHAHNKKNPDEQQQRLLALQILLRLREALDKKQAGQALSPSDIQSLRSMIEVGKLDAKKDLQVYFRQIETLFPEIRQQTANASKTSKRSEEFASNETMDKLRAQIKSLRDNFAENTNHMSAKNVKKFDFELYWMELNVKRTDPPATVSLANKLAERIEAFPKEIQKLKEAELREFTSEFQERASMRK